MKKKIIIGAVIGLILGLFQVLVPYVLTTEKPSSVGYAEDWDGREWKRGWPLSTEDNSITPMPSPPINIKTIANIPLLMAGSIVIVFAAAPIVSRLRLSKKQAGIVAVSGVIGIALGVGQYFYISQRTMWFRQVDMTNVPSCEKLKIHPSPHCGVCPADQTRGNFCHIPDIQLDTRGWPLKHDVSLKNRLSIYENSPKLLANFAIILAGSLVAGVVIAKGGTKLVSKPKKSSPKKRWVS